jgi:tetratricopeptide (TPR) repeat protein
MALLNRKVIVYLTVLLAASMCAYGQQTKIDSLELILTTTSEVSKPGILNQLAEITRSKTPAKSRDYAQQALAIAKKFDNHPQEILSIKNIGIAYGYDNQYDLALETLLSALALAEKHQEWTLAGDNAINVGTVYYVILSNYEKGLEYYLKALQFYEKVNNEKGIASALSGIGIAYSDEKKFAEALETLQKSLEIYQDLDEKKEIPKVQVNIGTCYKKMEDYPQALRYLNEAIRGFEELNNNRGKAHALFIVAQILRVEKKFAEAIENLNEALVLNENSNHKNSISDCLLELGKTFLDMEDHNEAEKYFLRVVAVAREINKKEHVSEGYKYLSTIYAHKKDYAKAFNYLSEHKTAFDSIFSAEKSKQIAEMQARFDSERKEKEIVMLRQEKTLNQIYLFVAIGVLLSISMIGFLVFNRQKLKMKKDRELAEKEAQLMEERRTLYEAELRNRELTEEQLQSQLDYKNKELASYTLNLIQKNEILENLKESVEEIRSSPESQVKQKLNGLVNMVNYSFHLDRDWENFKMHFEQVHRDFFKRLIEKYPDLNANDLKLCSLIKLNLDNRGIAAILNISQESAKVARHRLRKKLDLSAEQTLIAFLNAVE